MFLACPPFWDCNDVGIPRNLSTTFATSFGAMRASNMIEMEKL
jgi:hypothetical protein